MDEPKIGDKIFLYGQLLRDLEEFGDYEYNSLMGYATVGGYVVELVKSDIIGASVPGFVVDFCEGGLFTPPTPFLTDVSDKMALRSPRPIGTRIWTVGLV